MTGSLSRSSERGGCVACVVPCGALVFMGLAVIAGVGVLCFRLF